ncbi:Signal transduction histidine kinase [Cnuella takakiae]|uniref:Signal transduction histidine kinase n=1 Tax=Cnuella takakiae TaxID=1302690 RepID=A0A1M5IBP4_9BACT|nr:ATP-binding protein [Cnuella takakiae]OLY90788.1 hypothetical protein BUE76_01895 [Cnuella takakiae]SHG25682.1 Signal transduction histidine kinase [Cnuella takakiae]
MLLLAIKASWFIIIGSASLLLVLIFFFLLLYQYYRRRLSHVQELYALRRNYDAALLQSQLEIQEQTYSQISEEIHDNIGQVLSLVKLNINTLDRDSNPEKISTTNALLAQAIADLRNLSHLLNTNYIREAGFSESIQQLLLHLQKSGQYRTRLVEPEGRFSVDGQQAIILFRMVQEIVSNALRHAGANEFCVTLEQSNGRRRIVLSDNGRGFDTSILNQPGGGLGIRNMKQRAASVGAAVDIESQPNQGTTITICLNA